MQPGSFMSEKLTRSMVRIEFESTDSTMPASSLLEEIRKIFDSYEIAISYESIYGENFELDTTKIRIGGNQ
jgi:hypothetical protein